MTDKSAIFIQGYLDCLNFNPDWVECPYKEIDPKNKEWREGYYACRADIDFANFAKIHDQPLTVQ